MAYRENINLKSNKKLAVGTVYETSTYYNSPNLVFIKFYYTVDNTKYYGQSGIKSNNKHYDCLYLRKVLVGHTFSVIYDSLNYDNCKILLSKKDFERYNMNRTDSLNRFYQIIDSIQSK